MNINELKNLDPNNIGAWPIPIKALVILALCAVVLGAGYWFDTQHQIHALGTARNSENDLKS